MHIVCRINLLGQFPLAILSLVFVSALTDALLWCRISSKNRYVNRLDEDFEMVPFTVISMLNVYSTKLCGIGFQQMVAC